MTINHRLVREAILGTEPGTWECPTHPGRVVFRANDHGLPLAVIPPKDLTVGTVFKDGDVYVGVVDWRASARLDILSPQQRGAEPLRSRSKRRKRRRDEFGFECMVLVTRCWPGECRVKVWMTPGGVLP